MQSQGRRNQGHSHTQRLLARLSRAGQPVSPSSPHPVSLPVYAQQENEPDNLLSFARSGNLPRASGEGRTTSRSGSGRYVGKSLRHPQHAQGPATTSRTPSTPLRLPVEQHSPSVRFRVPALPWSARLVVTVCLLVGVTLGMRLTSLFTPVADSPVGVQATHAAYARVLAGQISPAGEQSGLLLGAPPWEGITPVNPLAGLPLFNWLSAAGMSLAAPGEWVGRLLAALFSVVAAFALFAIVRRMAGSLAAVYASLFFAVSPLSVTLGQQYSPATMILAAQALSVLTLLWWHDSVSDVQSQGSTSRFAVSLAGIAVAALLDPASLFLAVPATYIILSVDGESLHKRLPGRSPQAAVGTWRDAWGRSSHRGKVIAWIGVLLAATAGWWLYSSKVDTLVLGPGDGTGGPADIIANLFNFSSYTQLIGGSIGRVLLVVGLLLLMAGVLHGARQGLRGLFTVWLAVGFLHALFDSARLTRHEDVLLPLLLPACALVGIGASWAGSLPARIARAVTEQQREPVVSYAVSPHTAWLLDLPEIRTDGPGARPQARPALAKSVAERAHKAGERARRASLMAVGHVVVLAALGLVAVSGWQSAWANTQPTVDSVEIAEAGREIGAITEPGAKLVLVGPHAPELFYVSGRSGWALDEENFSILQVQELHRSGAAYLVSADQEWLGQHPDYVGLLANYSVKKLARRYIMFDLNTKPSDNDRLYFLESGHTLGGAFRRFWELNGAVSRLGYPISEEVSEANPLDGQVRTVQYFERAVLELHPEFAGTKDEVMLAAVGRWVTKDRRFQQITPFESTAERAYFPQTGHSIKEAFLRYWQQQGGLAAFGYPISEELPEISPADGKVYTVQYFERARFEWHPADAGTADEVQLGLIGKQALEMR